MAVNNNLYPPVVNTYMPAFLVDDDVALVYFSLSEYDTESEIKNVQVVISNQNTTISALDETKYPSGIMLTQLKKDNNVANDEKYYIEINSSDLADGEFKINQYYKVQLRFTSTAASAVSLTTPQKINTWLTSNLNYFSEWSTVCLIRGISMPVLSIEGFDTLATEAQWKTSNVELLGRIDFADSSETEILKSYRIRLYKVSNGELLIDSGVLYNKNDSNVNEFKYKFTYFLENNVHYEIRVDYTTNDLYEDYEEYLAVAVRDNSLAFSPSVFTIETDDENGRTKVTVKTSSNFNDDVVILRSSSETNFTIWEDVHKGSCSGRPLDLTWYDYTIESGILYKYGVQERRANTNLQSDLIRNQNTFGVVFDHCFLTEDSKQLKIKFNSNISSMKRNISDIKIDTIGSQFPYIKRNGSMNYRTFPIAGLISFLSDEDELFSSRVDIYGNSNVEAYNSFDENHGIKNYNNITYEREFRKKVSEFLSKNSYKLFRSPTEGNIVVRLTDVSFSPANIAGRYLWNFNCTAYEMDDCSIDNYIKYNILDLSANNIGLIKSDAIEDSIKRS